MLWTAKHAPASMSEFAGNPEAVAEARKWAADSARGKPVKPLLLFGPCGVGKTALAHCLANEMGWQVIESSAGDLRDAESLSRLYGAACESAGLFAQQRLILVDEADAVSDRSEFSALESIVKQSRQPVMLIANDAWNPKLSGLRFSCVSVEMRKVNSATIRRVLDSIAAKEGADAFFAEEISKSAAGDLRSAINDLQASVGMPLTGGIFELFSREREESTFNAVRKVFKAATYAEASQAGKSFDTQEFSFFVRWLEENVPMEYEDVSEIAQAFSWLSRADIFSGRIMRRQHWGFLKYARALSVCGVALSKRQPYHKFTKYSFPSILKTLGQSKKSRNLMLGAVRKTASKLRVSMEDARGMLPQLAQCPGMANGLGLSEDEAALVEELYAGAAPKAKVAARKRS
ncbi:MAG: AAA family ATPase [Candidatus Micrarchaeota archaeon]